MKQIFKHHLDTHIQLTSYACQLYSRGITANIDEFHAGYYYYAESSQQQQDSQKN